MEQTLNKSQQGRLTGEENYPTVLARNQTNDLLIASPGLYQLSYPDPPNNVTEPDCAVSSLLANSSMVMGQLT